VPKSLACFSIILAHFYELPTTSSADKGSIRRSHEEDLINQASCLNLVVNAVITWNTIYMAAAIDQLKAEGFPVQESDLQHLWPTRYEHINVHGKIRFNLEEELKRKGLRPLRTPETVLP